MPAAEACARTHPRGLTLIEILIAVGIVIALSAIVLPIASWSFRLRPLDSARDGVESVILQARAHARIEGRPVEVRLLGRRLEARWFDAGTASSSGSDDGRMIAGDDAFDSDLESSFDQRIGMSWARRLLPEGIECRTLEEHRALLEDRDLLGLEGIELPVDESPDFDPDALAPDPLPLAVLLADGGALALDPVVLLDPAGAGLLVEIDPWTGRPLFEPAPVAPTEDPGDPEDSFPEAERDPAPTPGEVGAPDPGSATGSAPGDGS